MKVAKFGGSSLADASQIKNVCNIILSDQERKLIVVSAPGKSSIWDIKITDMLINLANNYIATGNVKNELQLVVDRYKSIVEDLNMNCDVINLIEDDLTIRLNTQCDNKEKFIDLIKSAGEDNCAKILASYLKCLGVNAEYINPLDAGLILTEECGNARVLPSSYDKLSKLREGDTIKIFPGFFGYSEKGEVVTFSRGGSDVTGAVLAAAVQATMYENFTDVDSVYAANPNIVENPAPIPIFTYAEMRELSYAGFSVLHEETLEPVYKKGIPVNIKNTNNPSAPGTLIVPWRKDDDNRPVVGIAADKGFFTINITKYMMNREIGFGRSLLEILENEDVSYEHTPSGIDTICVVVGKRNCSKDKLNRIICKIYEHLSVDNIIIKEDIAIVMIVGQGMMKRIGVASKATNALSEAGVNISMINQGSSEVSIMFGVSSEDAVVAVNALYKAFFSELK